MESQFRPLAVGHVHQRRGAHKHKRRNSCKTEHLPFFGPSSSLCVPIQVWNGRVAMLAFVGCVILETITGTGVIPFVTCKGLIPGILLVSEAKWSGVTKLPAGVVDALMRRP